MRWGWFSAHRYLRSGSTARTVGADGRPLQRPWRVWSETAEQECQRIRAGRPQPIWPRALGWTLLGVAVLAVIDANHPLPREAPASSARPAESLVWLAAESPDGPCEGVPREFRWSGDVAPPYRLVVLDGGYAELVRIDDLGAPACPPSAALAALLATGGTFHWYVEGEREGHRTRSPLQTVEIR